jgi:oxalate decarboxylase/phosphoglucose isomerase-like protein (cupin superfamily)
MIERFGKAMGLRIPLGKNRQVELWYCPKGTRVPPHIHEHIDSFIVYLFGRMRVTVEHTTREVCGPVRRRESTGRLVWATRYIPKGVRHCAEVVGKRAIFLNFERCHLGRNVSAAKDFVAVE